MRDAVAALVHDGDVVAIEGFTHLICFAAGHEIIRQRKRDLTLARLTPDLIYDQMVAAGVGPQARLLLARQSRASAGCTPSAAASRTRIRRHSSWRSTATSGWSGDTRPAPRTCPSSRCARTSRSDLPKANPLIRPIHSPYGDETVYAVPPLQAGRDGRPRPAGRRRGQHPDVGPARLPEGGGLRRRACHRRGGGAGLGRRSIRADPNRTVIPGLIVDAVVVEPWGAHPSYVQGAYDRDNRFYREWDAISREAATHAGLAGRMGLRRRRPSGVHREARGRSGGRSAALGHGAFRFGRLRGLRMSEPRPTDASAASRSRPPSPSPR